MSTRYGKEMKRVKKTIISNTITFILITLFVSLFSKVFGNENSIIGVCTVIIGLCIVEKDLTQNPLRRFFWILVLKDRKSTRLNSSHANISYAVFCLKKKKRSAQQ